MKDFYRSIAALLMSVLCCCVARQQVHPPAFQFHPPGALVRRNTLQQVQRAPPLQQQQRPLDVAVDQSTKPKLGQTALEFQASTNYATEPLLTTPESIQQCNLADFLFQDAHRNMILAGADSQNRVEVLRHPDVRLYHLWNVETGHQKNLAAPSVGDAILRVTTTGIHFPGLTLKTVATVGCKNVLGTHPSLQITLIQDKLQAQGPDPLVWVFNQLTGAGNSRSSSASDQQRRTHSTNIISAECVNGDNDLATIIFRSVAKLSISVRFPSFLLRILPVSKQMAESQGSDAINRVVTRDIGPSLDALKKEYEKKIKQSDE